jgi:hypothetical protein
VLCLSATATMHSIQVHSKILALFLQPTLTIRKSPGVSFNHAAGVSVEVAGTAIGADAGRLQVPEDWPARGQARRGPRPGPG